MFQCKNYIPSRILETVQAVTAAVPIPENETIVIIPLNSFAVSVQEVEVAEFEGQTFSALLDFVFGEDERIDVDDLVFEESPVATTSITLPPTIFMSIPMNTSSRIIHSVFLTDSLFTTRKKTSIEVGSIIISAAIAGNIKVKGLEPPIMLTFVKSPVS